MSHKLTSWATQAFGDLKNRKKRVLARLHDLQQCDPDASILAQCNYTSLDLDEIHRLKESYWHVSACANEIRDGDKNTMYFYHKASQRKRHNTIHGLLDENGVWKKGRDDICDIVHHYFA